jgi:hypothetical protein
MKLGSVLKVTCPACAKACSHKVLFSGGSIEHRHCSECQNIGVFASEMGEEDEEGKKKKKWTSIDYAALMERQGSRKPVKYSIKKAYTDGDYMSHPSFGAGYVLNVLPPHKMEVLFEESKKLLACGPGSTNGAGKQNDKQNN